MDTAALPAPVAGGDAAADFEEQVMIATAVSAAEAAEEAAAAATRQAAGGLAQGGALAIVQQHPADETALCVAQAAERLLLGLPPANATAVCVTLRNILQRILDSPRDSSKRRLRLGNAKVQKRVVAVPGAVQFLLSCGFVRTDGSGGGDPAGGESAIELPDAPTAAAAAATVPGGGGGFDASLLRRRSAWLDTLAARAAERGGARQIPDCLVKLVLPEGETFKLGFGRGEALGELARLARGFFWPTRSCSVQLCQRVPKKRVLAGAELERTFADLGFLPNVVLVVDPVVSAERAFQNATPASLQAAMVRTKLRAPEDSAAARQKRVELAEKHARDAKAKARADKERKDRANREFQSDRQHVAAKEARRRRQRAAEEQRQAELQRQLEEQRRRDQARAGVRGAAAAAARQR